MTSTTDNPYAPPSIAPPERVVRGEIEIVAALQIGWRGFSNNVGIGIVTAIVAALYATIAVIGTLMGLLMPIVGAFPLTFFMVFVGMALHTGLMHVSVKIADGGMHRQGVRLAIGDLLAGFRGAYIRIVGLAVIVMIPFAILQILPFFISGSFRGAGAFIVTTAWLVGLILFAAPVLFAAIRFFLVPPLIVERPQEPLMSACAHSWRCTSGLNMLRLAALMMLVLVIILAGTMLLIVGVVPATAIAMGTMGAAYRQLSST